jgi:hypothetical protein
METAWMRRSEEQSVCVDNEPARFAPVESIPDRERNHIRVTRTRLALRRKVRHTRRVRSKSARALREAIAAEGSAADHVLPRWNDFRALRLLQLAHDREQIAFPFINKEDGRVSENRHR